MDSILTKAAPWVVAATAVAGGAEASMVRDASHIALVRIVSSRPGEWQAAPRQTRTRRVELRLRVERVLKGDGKRRELSLVVDQTEPAGPMDVAVPGAWSQRAIDRGREYVIFSRSASLAGQETLGVRTARESLADTELALRSDAEGWTLPRSLEAGARSTPGPLFADYAVARLPELLFTRYEQFDAVMTLLENGPVTGVLRVAIVEAAFSRFLLADPAPPRFVSRLAASSLRLIAGPDRVLRRRLIETLLPNLVGLEGGATRKTGAEVLADYPADAERARRQLRSEQTAAASRLLAWLP